MGNWKKCGKVVDGGDLSLKQLGAAVNRGVFELVEGDVLFHTDDERDLRGGVSPGGLPSELLSREKREGNGKDRGLEVGGWRMECDGGDGGES